MVASQPTETKASSVATRLGDVLAGKYRVERILGQGGMGVVLAAHHLQLDEPVALKLLLPSTLDAPHAVARFVREARAAAKIKSEHVARVLDAGELEDGSPYIAMEYLEGADLSAWLKQRGAMPVEQAVDFVLQACEAIAEAHALGILHRDLKPSNLFCIRRPDGEDAVKVLDFGISKVTSVHSGTDSTLTAGVVGTPAYMSPEQMRMSREVDVTSDIWSLGVILFELVTARRPFHADTVPDLAIQIVNDPAPPLRAVRVDAPSALEHAVSKCLEKDRRRRFQSVAELAIALQGSGSARARLSAERVAGTLRNQRRPKLAVTPAPIAATHHADRPASILGATVSLRTTQSPLGSSGKTVLRLGAGAIAIGLAAFAVFFFRAPSSLWLRESGAAKPASSVSAAPRASLAEPSSLTPASRSFPPSEDAGSESVAVAESAAPNPPNPPTNSQEKVAPAPRHASAPINLPLPLAAVSSSSARPAPATSARSVPLASGPAGSASLPAQAAGLTVNCKPPYVIDSEGFRRYKPECLGP